MAAKAAAPADLSESQPVLASELDDVLGHGLIKNLLGRMIQERRLPQALLFAGPPLLGKRSLAVVLAKRILSGLPEPDVEGQESLFGDDTDSAPDAAGSPFDSSADFLSPAEALRPDPAISRRVTRGIHLDFTLLQPEGNSKVVKIEQVRALQDWAWISPSEGRAKTALVFGADTITEEAANSFLKLLEEPPPKLTLILVSDFPHRLLDTVRSRCTAFAFHPIPVQEMEAWLKSRHGLDADRARLVAGLSEGRPGLALKMTEEDAAAVRKPVLGELEILLANGFLALPGVAARCLRHAGGLRPALESLLLLLRDALVLADAPPSPTHPSARPTRDTATPSAPDASRPFGSEADSAPTADVAGQAADLFAHETRDNDHDAPDDELDLRDKVLGVDLLDPLAKTFHGLPRESLLRAAEAVAQGLDLTRHLFIPSETLILETVLADVGAALRKPSRR